MAAGKAGGAVIATGEHVEVDGWLYEVRAWGGYEKDRPRLVVLSVTPWGSSRYTHVVALSTLERVWSGEWPACRLGAPSRRAALPAWG